MPDATDARLAALEERLARVEDELAITRLIASYGPLVDGGEADLVAGLWTEDGVYDVDEGHMAGRGQLAAMVRSRAHQGWIAGGCAHFLGPAHVTLDGDTAVAVCHSLMVVNDGGEFGSDAAFGVRRATAHHFELVRSDDGWRVARRTSRVLDGRPEAPALLVRGATGQPA
ncbi:MAG TPA: nuclear transport factor 2 family protein [Nocardioides sp.]|nr:nuclear transport factor 2 family protein [Nocardioides sp.]